ncbi:unnamed protein product [Tuber aestivum]|uniref:Nucleoporin NDC1 n=1 Tax=Tuber aestivum TaxID=59557 RepID=A0A292PSZ0_9PEZI|nr:unnamed protein product [Tuber aestivum]
MVSSISRSIPSSTPPRSPPPHYQTFLTPILHRRFARACLVGFAACYVESFVISNKSSFFWAIFPLGWTGFKAVILFFLSVFPILILRISQLHVGARSYTTVFHAMKTYIGSFSTYSTLLTHSFASLVFVFLYLWSGSREDRLGFIIEGKSYERPRLNERFLYMIFFACYTGFIQAALHLYEDRGRLQLPHLYVWPSEVEPTSVLNAELSQLSPKAAFKKKFLEVPSGALHMALVSACTAPFAYMPFRGVVWHYTLATAKTFYWLNRSSTLPSFPVGAGMFIRSLWLSFLIGVMWQISNIAFDVYFTQKPLSADGKTVSEKSPDPNGTLVTGLKASQAPLTQMLAFWELAYLSQNSAARRKAIYTDINRKPANIFEQILNQALSVLGEIDLKLADVGKPPAPTAVISITPSSTAASTIPSPPPIPMSPISPLLTSPTSPTRKFLEGVQSKDGSTPTLQHVIQKLPYQPPSIAEVEASATKSFKSKMEPFLSSPWGSMFRQSIHATTSQLLPNVGLQINAVQAISRLVTSSLMEDEFGIVQRHASTLLASFISTMGTLEKYLASPPISWTDVEAIQKQEKGELNLVEPHLLLSALKEGFKDMATAYAPHIEKMQLSPQTKKIILEARERSLP